MSFSGLGTQPALVLSLSAVLAAIILFDTNRLLRRHAPSIHRGDALKIRIVVVAFACIAGGVAALIATTEESGATLICAERCGAPNEPMALLPNGAPR